MLDAVISIGIVINMKGNCSKQVVMIAQGKNGEVSSILPSLLGLARLGVYESLSDR